MRFELRCPSLIMSHPKKRHCLLLIIHAPDQFSLKSPSSEPLIDFSPQVSE